MGTELGQIKMWSSSVGGRREARFRMFCSTIIPTIGRGTLDRALWSVLDQDFVEDDFEVIVVNDSSRPLAAKDWQHTEQVRVINTNGRERSVARNAGAAIARGKYLHFLDDDDWLLPGALESLWQLARKSDANWLYGGTELVDRNGKSLIQLHHQMAGNCFIQVMAGEWIPIQSSLIDAEAFFAIGGFDPLLAGPEDIDLCRRMALRWDIAETSALVACIGMGAEGSSTDSEQSRLDARRAREKILNEPGVFRRMHGSANCSYWHGRIVRAYLTSTLWNLRDSSFFAAMSRLLLGLLGILTAASSLLSRDFWRAVAFDHESEVFLRGIEVANSSRER